MTDLNPERAGAVKKVSDITEGSAQVEDNAGKSPHGQKKERSFNLWQDKGSQLNW